MVRKQSTIVYAPYPKTSNALELESRDSFGSLENSPKRNLSNRQTTQKRISFLENEVQGFRIKPEKVATGWSATSLDPLDKLNINEPQSAGIARRSQQKLSMTRKISRDSTKKKSTMKSIIQIRDREFSHISNVSNNSNNSNNSGPRSPLLRITAKRHQTYRVRKNYLKPLTLEEQKTQKNKFYFDLRYWKAWPISRFCYQSESYDSVLPTIKQKSFAQKNEQVWKRIRSARIPCQYSQKKFKAFDNESSDNNQSSNRLSSSRLPIKKKSTSVSPKMMRKSVNVVIQLEKVGQKVQETKVSLIKDGGVAENKEIEKKSNKARRESAMRALKLLELNTKRRSAMHHVEKKTLGVEDEEEKDVNLSYDTVRQRLLAPIGEETTGSNKKQDEDLETVYQTLRVSNILKCLISYVRL